MIGYIDHFAFSPDDKLIGSSTESFLQICRNAHAIWRAETSDASYTNGVPEPGCSTARTSVGSLLDEITMRLADELKARTFHFGRADGTPIAVLTLSRLRGLGLFLISRPLLINGLAGKGCTTAKPQFRDTKDQRFGMGLSSTRIGEAMRRDRLLLISAFATALLTLLGAVGESLGMDRLLKSNTRKVRTHSLFRQGCMLYELIPNMPEHPLLPLMEKFAAAVSSAGVLPPVIANSK